ncbi:MAG: phospholipase D family protein [Ignavibacteria bacterium]|jgi:phosphatidylserine/phosphatidylglycerophosphate/cardiolipin synthase-like enzyme|nr:phospholipase D family protein [Ignavibacteria bacterium]
MPKFLRTDDLNLEIRNIIENANNEIILISPYISLSERLKLALKKQITNEKLKIILVYGKNPYNQERSFNNDDYDFLQNFPNIEIRYLKNLHAKYYANEQRSIITSMNLYEYSQAFNFEAGILIDNTAADGFTNDVRSFFTRIIDTSEVEICNTINIVNTTIEATIGYCISTRQPIPFNIDMPFSDEAYKKWLELEEVDHPENFCHFTGEQSNGETSMRRPILNKYYYKAKKKYNL